MSVPQQLCWYLFCHRKRSPAGIYRIYKDPIAVGSIRSCWHWDKGLRSSEVEHLTGTHGALA